VTRADADARRAGTDTRDLVVLAHGLGRTPLSMAWLARSLRTRGYRTLNWGYSSYTRSVPELGEALADAVAAAAADAPRIHFVGHSLGTLLIRWVLVNRPPPAVGRAVLLAPPNQGARKADRAAPWLGWLLPPLADLRSAPEAEAARVGTPPGVELGIIAGSADRTVTLAETHLDGAADHAQVDSGHTFIMVRRDVRRLVDDFLRTGSFAG
jgi:alpha-beta hydrolase superfamily lysophospholipase